LLTFWLSACAIALLVGADLRPSASAPHNDANFGIGTLATCGAFVMIVEKLRQLLAQALIPLGLVAQHDRPLEQGLLEFARKLTPQIEGSQPQNVRKSIGVRFSALDWSHFIHPPLAICVRRRWQRNCSSPAVGAGPQSQ
jgi:hypothetical protein